MLALKAMENNPINLHDRNEISLVEKTWSCISLIVSKSGSIKLDANSFGLFVRAGNRSTKADSNTKFQLKNFR